MTLQSTCSSKPCPYCSPHLSLPSFLIYTFLQSYFLNASLPLISYKINVKVLLWHRKPSRSLFCFQRGLYVPHLVNLDSMPSFYPGLHDPFCPACATWPHPSIPGYILSSPAEDVTLPLPPHRLVIYSHLLFFENTVLAWSLPWCLWLLSPPPFTSALPTYPQTFHMSPPPESSPWCSSTFLTS